MKSDKTQQGTLFDVQQQKRSHSAPPSWMNKLLLELAGIVQGNTKPGLVEIGSLRIDKNSDQWLPRDKHLLTVCGSGLRRVQYKSQILTSDGEPTGREISLAAIQLNPEKSSRPGTPDELRRDTMFYIILRREDGRAVKGWTNRRAILYSGSSVVKLFGE